MRYDAHKTLIAPARPTASLPLLIGGVFLTIMVYYSLNYLVWMVVFAALTSDESWALMTTLDEARTPGAVLVNLAVFILLPIALAVTLKVLHQRSLASLVGPVFTAIRQFRRVLFMLAMLFAVLFIIPVPDDLAPSANLAFGQWLILLPLTLLTLLIQTSAEELAFRGYIQSQLAACFSSPVIWLCAPSLLFGLVHYNPELHTQNAVIVVLWATMFDMVAADLTARSGSLGPAIALHFVNNFSAIAIAAPDGPFDGLALMTYPFSLASTEALMLWAPIDLMVLLCAWLAARLALRR